MADIGSVWETGTWADSSWAEDSWADAVVRVIRKALMLLGVGK